MVFLTPRIKCLRSPVLPYFKRMSSSPGTTAPLILSTAEFQRLETKPVLLDASWHMPASPRKPRDEFRKKRIQGASGYLDLDEVASPNEHGFKHMMPSERVFADACGKYNEPVHSNYYRLIYLWRRKVWDHTVFSCRPLRHSRSVFLSSRFIYVSRFRCVCSPRISMIFLTVIQRTYQL